MPSALASYAPSLLLQVHAPVAHLSDRAVLGRENPSLTWNVFREIWILNGIAKLDWIASGRFASQLQEKMILNEIVGVETYCLDPDLSHGPGLDLDLGLCLDHAPCLDH